MGSPGSLAPLGWRGAAHVWVRPASQGVGRSSGLGGDAGGSWRGFQLLPSLGTGCPLPGAARLRRLPPLSSVNAGLALKSEECFAGAAFWAGSRAQSVQSPWAVRCPAPRRAAGAGRVSRMGSSGLGWRTQCRGELCRARWQSPCLRVAWPCAVAELEQRRCGMSGCCRPLRLLLPGEAALGSISALAGCGHRSDGIKMLVLIWQRQLWDINRRCFAGKKENDNTFHQNYYSAVP